MILYKRINNILMKQLLNCFRAYLFEVRFILVISNQIHYLKNKTETRINKIRFMKLQHCFFREEKNTFTYLMYLVLALYTRNIFFFL